MSVIKNRFRSAGDKGGGDIENNRLAPEVICYYRL